MTKRHSEIAGGDLPLLHRLAIAYLMLPVIVFLVGWFEWGVGIPVSALVLLALRRALSGSWRLRLRPRTIALLAVAFGWVMVTAAGGVFDLYNGDWRYRRILLIELGRYPWPAYLPDPLTDLLTANAPAQTEKYLSLLRYYLGCFMVPGLAARLLGPAALNWAVPLWIGIGVALILALFTRHLRGYGIALGALILIFFSGMDIVRVILFEGWNWIDLRVDYHGWPGLDVGKNHIEWYWILMLQYSSTMTTLMWAPHHFISAGLYALLLRDLCRHPRFLAVSGILLAVAPFWSAVVAIGLLPLLAVALFKNGIRPFLRWPNLLLSLPLAGLMVLYLTSGSLDFRFGYSIEGHEWSSIPRSMSLFYLIEFLPIAVLLLLLHPGLRRDPFFVASIATLLLLPWYKYGANNVLILRSPLPSLFLLCSYCADVLARHRVNIIREGPTWRRLALVGLAGVLCVGSVTAFIELARATRHDGFFKYAEYAEKNLTILADLPFFMHREIMGRNPSDALRWLLREPDGSIQTGEKGELLARAPFDVYRYQNFLIYAKTACSEEDKDRFQIALTPVNRADLRPVGRLVGFNLSGFRIFSTGDACGGLLKLPEYDLLALNIGQRVRNAGAWEVEIAFDADGGVRQVLQKSEKDYRTDYESLTSGEPIIRADLDVYLGENGLTYVKDPCILSRRERVFLHIFPRDANDLVPQHRHSGFDQVIFKFRNYGRRFDDKCMVTIPLPDYDIARIRTGRLARDGSIAIAWETSFSVGEE